MVHRVMEDGDCARSEGERGALGPKRCMPAKTTGSDFGCFLVVRSPVRRTTPPRRPAGLRIDSFALKVCPEMPVHWICSGNAVGRKNRRSPRVRRAGAPDFGPTAQCFRGNARGGEMGVTGCATRAPHPPNAARTRSACVGFGFDHSHAVRAAVRLDFTDFRGF